jgi:hypothetical protein
MEIIDDLSLRMSTKLSSHVDSTPNPSNDSARTVWTTRSLSAFEGADGILDIPGENIVSEPSRSIDPDDKVAQAIAFLKSSKRL